HSTVNIEDKTACVLCSLSLRCWSHLGGQQVISLQQRGCVHHEQNCGDRDNNVTVVTENISKGKEHIFRKVETNNLMIPYDYTFVMHYGRYAFAKDYGKLPTIIPKPDSSVQIGGARQMSRQDIVRVNMFYNCREYWALLYYILQWKIHVFFQSCVS
ncbi:high choriolytic enzyme 1-like, partial [Oncorhynchus kisutch]|uniref:high choriolytic enzyme 1-like n=1 Tax=Oncorhynchus kisutch TaxID=8019 RepID=UPI0012DF0625